MYATAYSSSETRLSSSTEKSQIIRPKKRVFEFLAEALENGHVHVLLKGQLILSFHSEVIPNLILYGFFDLPFSYKLSSRRKVKTSVQKGGERRARAAEGDGRDSSLLAPADGVRCAGETQTKEGKDGN